jgi:hypothetical protein
MASADFWHPIPTPFDIGSTRQVDRSPRVIRVTFIPHTCRIYSHTFLNGLGLQRVVPSRPDMTASYAIPVRQARTLLAAFFRFRVAPDTLAVRLTVPTIRVRRGLSPPSHQPATIADWMALARHAPYLAHTKKRRNRNRLRLIHSIRRGIYEIFVPSRL